MAHFFGEMQGRGKTQHCTGLAGTGIQAHIRGEKVGVFIDIKTDPNGQDYIEVYQTAGDPVIPDRKPLGWTKKTRLVATIYPYTAPETQYPDDDDDDDHKCNDCEFEAEDCVDCKDFSNFKKVGQLTTAELDKLKEVLERLELGILKTEGWHYYSGGFCTADMFDYDDEKIDIEVKSGVQSDCEDRVYTEQCTIERGLLTSGATVPQIIERIEW